MTPPDLPSGGARVRLDVWVRPGSARPGVEWDPWRKRWCVSVRAEARDGLANRELVELLAERLAVPVGSVRLVRGGSSHGKVVEVVGCDAVGAIERLSRPPP